MSKRNVIVLSVLVLTIGVGMAARMDPALAQKLATSDNPNQKFAVSFTMKAQASPLDLDANIPNLPKPQRRARVAEVLREYANASQHDLMAYLKTSEAAGSVDGLNSLWLVNEVACFATKDVILNAANRDDVSEVMSDLVPTWLEIPKVVANPPPHDGVEPNLNVTQAPAAWRMGYTGQNVVVGEVDTGIWYTHQDLMNHLWTSSAYPHCGFNYGSVQLFPSASNPSPNDTTNNIDYVIGHGTHCAGIVSADGNYGNGTHDTMGVAPSAKMLVCNALVYFNGDNSGETLLEQSCLLGFQFCVSPPRDPLNGCDVITTSLGIFDSYHPRYANWRLAERNVMLAGVTHAVAAGNEASPMTIRCPGDVPPPWPNPANNPTDTATAAVITVGATDNSDNAASFTSKGPSTIWGNTPPYNDYVYPPGLTDPDVCCPGVNILSTFWQGDQAYTTMSGTSMATPGTAGCVALMYSKDPNLTPREVDSILEMTSHDLGTSGKDNTYGQGRINCSLAVAMTPLPGPSHNIGIGAIYSPAMRVDPGAAITPTVLVVNAGTFHETSIPVHFAIDSSGTEIYNHLVTIPSLDSAAVDTVTFPTWNAATGLVTYEVTAWHSYSPDTNRMNDTMHRTVMTKAHDVAATSTNFSSRVRAGQPMTPKLTLTVPGDYTEYSFPATCRIDSAGTTVYNQTVTVDSVMPEVPFQVSFPDWTPGPDSAQYDITLFHSLATDQNRSNDTLYRHVMASDFVMRVAIEMVATSPGRNPPNAIYRIDSLCRAQGWDDSIVVGTDLATVDQLNQFSVVVSGSDGHWQQTDFGTYQDALLDWMRGGGGFVGCGWIVYGICGELGTTSKMDTVLAVMTDGNYTFAMSGNVTITNPNHPITDGVNSFPVQQYGEYAAAGIWADAVALGSYGGSEGSIVYKEIGAGRSVYLGPIYYGDFGNYANEPYYDDVDAMRLMKQAIEWAATGGSSGIKTPPQADPAVLRFALNAPRPNPMNGTTHISYALPLNSPVRMTVYDLSGREVARLVNGTQKAGTYSLNWNRANRTGSAVASGIYFLRLETPTNTATRKLVVK